jgi:hypothetical protein
MLTNDMRRSSRGEIEDLIRARYSLIWVTSPEETRVEESLKKLCVEREMRLEVWSITEGFKVLANGQGTRDVKDPMKAIDHVIRGEGRALYVLRDFHPFLKEPAVVRRLRDAATELRKTKKSLLVLSPVTKIPPELEKSVSAIVDWDLPNRQEIEQIARNLLPARRRRPSSSPRATRRTSSASSRRAGPDRGRGRERLRQGDGPHPHLRPRDDPRGEEADHPQERPARVLRAPRGVRRRRRHGHAQGLAGQAPLGVLQPRPRLRSAAAQGHPADRRARHRQVAHRQGGGRAVADAAAPPRRRQDLRRPGRQLGREHPHGDQDRRGGRAGDPVDRRAREGLLGHRQLGPDRRRHHVARVRLVHHLAAGEDLAGVRDRDREQRPPAAARALRKGRFDEIFFCDLPDREDRRSILDIHIRKKRRDPSQFDLEKLVDITVDFSGAEIEQAVVASLYDAFDTGGDLNDELLVHTLRETVPLAITMREMIESMREWARTRARPASSRRNAPPKPAGAGWMAKYGAPRGGPGDKPGENTGDDGERKLEL